MSIGRSFHQRRSRRSTWFTIFARALLTCTQPQMQNHIARRIAERIARVPKPLVVTREMINDSLERQSSLGVDPSRALILRKRSLSAMNMPKVAVLPDKSSIHIVRAPVKANISSTTKTKLPPLSHVHVSRMPHATLDEAQIITLRNLRDKDPENWTVRKLAKHFNVSSLFVSMTAPCPATRLTHLKSKQAQYMTRLNPKILDRIDTRQQRRAMW